MKHNHGGWFRSCSFLGDGCRFQPLIFQKLHHSKISSSPSHHNKPSSTPSLFLASQNCFNNFSPQRSTSPGVMQTFSNMSIWAVIKSPVGGVKKIEKRSYYGTQLHWDLYITRIPMNKPVYTIECHKGFDHCSSVLNLNEGLWEDDHEVSCSHTKLHQKKTW